MTPTPRTRDQLVWLVTAVLAGVGAVLWWQAPTLPELSAVLSWPLLAVLFAASERFAVHLPVGRDTQSTSFSEVPLVLGLFLLSAMPITAAEVVLVRDSQARAEIVTAEHSTRMTKLAAKELQEYFREDQRSEAGHRDKAQRR